MLRFKEFLIETPNPPNVKDLQDFTFQKEAGGNEKAVLRLHGGPNDPTIAYGHSLQDPERSRAKFKRILPEVNFDDIVAMLYISAELHKTFFLVFIIVYLFLLLCLQQDI